MAEKPLKELNPDRRKGSIKECSLFLLSTYSILPSTDRSFVANASQKPRYNHVVFWRAAFNY